MHAIALVVAILVAGAGATDPEVGFHEAEGKLAAGDTAGAIDAFVAVADDAPRST